MSSAKPYIGCKIGLISKAQNRYEGILYTIDKVNSTVVLAKGEWVSSGILVQRDISTTEACVTLLPYSNVVFSPVRCFGTEGRPTDRPTPPKDDIFEYITFRGSDIKDITLCEPPSAHHGLPPDPAIVQSSTAGASGVYSALGPFSPLRIPAYNQLAASSLLNQQYAAALGLGLHIRRGNMVEKAVQTLQVERSRQRRGLTTFQGNQQRWERRQPQRTRGDGFQTRRGSGTTMKSVLVVPRAQQETQRQNDENRPPPRRRQARRRRNRSRGQLMVTNAPSATLKFDTDFDFDSSNAQFIKEELEREGQVRMNMKDGRRGVEVREKEEFSSPSVEDHFGPKCYYDKAKSFFDNISSDNKFRLSWAEERKRNLETFGVPGRFLRSQGFRGGYTGRRGQGTSQTLPPYRTRTGQL